MCRPPAEDCALSAFVVADSKVSCNARHLAKTREKLTPYKDPDWMLLYIDSDMDKGTGWEGYDILINSEIGSKSTSLKVYEDGSWTKKGELAYSSKGNELMIEITRDVLGGSGFDFHWCDNVPVSGDIADFFTLGDNAPERRSNYRFEE